MASPLTTKGEVVREYLAMFPKSSKKGIARLLVKEHPLLFHSIDQARILIRSHTGTSGKHAKKYMKNQIKHETNFSRENPYGIPTSYELVREPFVLPKVENNILIISDLHIPYHNIAALECALDYGVKNKVNTVFINGDLLDFHGLSRFLKDPRKRNVKEEMDACIEFLTGLRKTFPKASIYYHHGNHDIRYQMWLMSHPEIFGDPYYELENRLGLNKLRIRTVDDKTITKAGKLSITHGHYIFRGASSPVSPARTMLLKAKQSMVCGHTHKISEATAMNLDGDIYTCFSTGSLCELLPDYTPMCNDYSHGFAHAVINNDGSFSLKNYRIHKGKIL
jgi:predicted phosphodiesterase